MTEMTTETGLSLGLSPNCDRDLSPEPKGPKERLQITDRGNRTVPGNCPQMEDPPKMVDLSPNGPKWGTCPQVGIFSYS
jgi:hypothetical protein